MRIAGIGFRDEAVLASVLDALSEVGDKALVDRVALAARKAGHPLAKALEGIGYTLVFVPEATLWGIETPTESAIARRIYGTGSLAEACALCAARSIDPGAWLARPRHISADRLASAALAMTGVAP